MSREANLVKNTFVLSLGTFLPKFISVLVTPILTAQLTKAEYGQYDLITTIVSLLLPAVTLQVSAAAFRFLIDKRNQNEECSYIISTIYAFVIIISLVTGFVFFLLVNDKVGANGILICAYFIADILLVSTGQMLRGLGKNLMYSLSAIIHSVVIVALLIVLTGVIGTVNMGLTGVLIAMLISTLVPLFVLGIAGGVLKYFKLSKVSIKHLKELLNYSWPMVPNNLSGWVLRLSDRLVITFICGIEANAIYAAACKMPIIFSSFQNTFMMAWQENASLALKDNDKDKYYSQMCDWVYRLLVGIMAVLICTTPIIWELLIRGDYNDAYYQLPLLYLGILFSCMSSTIGGVYIAHKKTKSVGITTMAAAFINFMVDIIFVRLIGIWAGSISTMVSYLFLLIYRMRDVQRFQRLYFDYKIIITGILLIAMMGVLCYQRNMACNLINIPICLFALLFFCKDIITTFMKIAKRKILKKK